MDEDKAIAEGVTKKDEKAFALLVDRYGGLIKVVVNYHLKNTMYAEECINDILLALWQNMSRFDSKKNSLKNWIGAVSKYKCIDYLRRCYRENRLCPLTEDIPAPPQEPESLAEELLGELNPKDRRLFYDRYISGKSVAEIAKETGDNPSRLYNRLSLGRKKLRKLFKERNGD